MSNLATPQIDAMADEVVRSVTSAVLALGDEQHRAFDILLRALVTWTAKFRGCAPLLGIAIETLETCRSTAEGFAKERAS
jgi:hypothetical protein